MDNLNYKRQNNKGETTEDEKMVTNSVKMSLIHI